MISYEHFLALHDDTGIFQHAKGRIPWREHGYCSDDVSRALLVAVRSGVDTPEMRRVARTSLSFLLDAENPGVGYRNFMSFDRRWLERAGSPDSQGRVVHCLAEAAARDPFGWLAFPARHSIERMLSTVPWRESPRTSAYLLLGLATHDAPDLAEEVAARLRYWYDLAATPDWRWFERYVTYCNAALPHALLRRPDERDQELGLRALEWLVAHETERGALVPTGNDGFAAPGRKALYDQQPIEIAEIAMAAGTAYRLTGDEEWRALVERCAGWFFGRNSERVEMADPADGAGFDGLSKHGPSLNAGAESTVAYLLTMQEAEALRVSPDR